MIERPAPPLLGANQDRELPEVSGEGGRSRQGGTISCPRIPLAAARSPRAAGGEEEAGAGVVRVLLVVEGEEPAANIFQAASPARRDVWQSGKVGEQGVCCARAIVVAAAGARCWSRWRRGKEGLAGKEEEEERKWKT